MNTPHSNGSGARLTADLENFVSALKNGTPVSGGKERSSAAAREARSAGRDGVHTNANKVNPDSGSEAPLSVDFTALERVVTDAAQASLTAAEELYEDRLEKAELRRTTRMVSGLKRVQKCLHTVRREAGTGMVIDYNAAPKDMISGFRGLYTCGSVWACDRCAAMIQRQRYLEVFQAMEQWTTKGAVIPTQYRDYGPEGKDGLGLLWETPDAGEFESGNHVLGPAGYIDARNGGIVWPGVNDYLVDEETGEITERPLRRFNLIDEAKTYKPGGIAFMTLTMRHKRASKADDKYAAGRIWAAESAAFKVFTNAKFFKGKIPAYQRSVEVQWSERAGWHVHIHVALYVTKGFRRELTEAKRRLFDAWQAAVELQGYEAQKPGFDLRMSTDLDVDAKKLAQYVTKGSKVGGLAAEMTVTGSKKSPVSISPSDMRMLLHEARMGRESPEGTPAILRVPVGANAKRYAPLLKAYQEYERASRGKRWMTWSRGAKKAFGILDTPDEDVTCASEGEESGDAMPLDAGTGEIGGFKGDHWKALAREVRNPVKLRGLLESVTNRVDAEAVITQWAEGLGLNVEAIMGEAWDARLEEYARKKDEARAAKTPKWASGLTDGPTEKVDPLEGLRDSGKWTWSDPAEVLAAAVKADEAGADLSDVLWDDSDDDSDYDYEGTEYEAA